MGNLDWDQVERILDEALDLPEEQRTSFVHEACKHNPELKEEVELILSSIKESEGWLDDPTQFKQDFFDEISEDLEHYSGNKPLIGKRIGSYEVKEKIGQGGMGAVYLAERTEGDFKHQVAIKLIDSEKATRENLDRFKQEKRILASLNHPGIAQLFDGGVTEDNIPYIIMEYVNGIPITDYCQQKACPASEKIELFIQVLEAVRNAHENLIIHSDLKPDNILINEDGNVKILDFGISKLLQNKGDSASASEYSGSALTPRYAAPEQVQDLNITTATDIYALGLVLYKLLTEVNAIDFEDRSKETIRSAILNDVIPAPSKKVIDPKQKRMLSGDLDAIILKAIQKEPEERYRSANDFISDLKKYLQDFPVSARPDTLSYRGTKFLKRHKGGSSLAFAALVIIVGLTFFYTRQIKEERNQAQIEAEKSQEITSFVIGLLEENYPENSQGDTVTVRQILDKSVLEIESINKSPDIKAKMQQVIGHAYNSVGEPHKAKPLLTKAIGILESEHIQNTDLAHTYNVAGIIYRDLGKLDSSQTYLEKSVSTFRSLSRRQVPEYPKALKNLAYVLRLRSDYEGALKCLEEALKIEQQIYGSDNINIAETIYILASVNRYMGNYEQALKYQNQSLDMVQANTDGPHPGIIANLSNIAVLNNILENKEVAKSSYKKALNMAYDLYGPTHPEIATISANLSSIYTYEGKFDSAKMLSERALEVSKKSVGTDHPRYGNYLTNYARMFFYKGDYRKADSIYTKAFQIFQHHYSPGHPEIASALQNMAEVAIAENELERASDLLERALTIRRTNFENKHPQLQDNISVLVDVYRDLGMTHQADSLSEFLLN